MDMFVAFAGYAAAILCGIAGAGRLVLSIHSFPSLRVRRCRCLALFAAGMLLFSVFCLGCFCWKSRAYTGGVRAILLDGVDSLANCALILLWLLFLWSLKDKGRGAFLWAAGILLCRFIVSCAAAALLADHARRLGPEAAAAVCFAEDMLILSSCVLILYGGLAAGREDMPRAARRYIFSVSSALMLLTVAQAIVNFKRYFSEGGALKQEIGMYGLLGILLGIVSAMTLRFLHRAVFSPIRTVGKIADETGSEAEAPEGDPAEKIDETQGQPAEPERFMEVLEDAYHLTRREREIAVLVYEGLSNPDIAARLSISINTAKRHIHHIFEKMAISSRIELVHCMNAIQPQSGKDTGAKQGPSGE